MLCAKYFGSEIHKLREKKNITPLELARAVDTSEKEILNIENGDKLPRLEMIGRLGSVLGFQLKVSMTKQNSI